jgi:hypothetical protein
MISQRDRIVLGGMRQALDPGPEAVDPIRPGGAFVHAHGIIVYLIQEDAPGFLNLPGEQSACGGVAFFAHAAGSLWLEYTIKPKFAGDSHLTWGSFGNWFQL